MDIHLRVGIEDLFCGRKIQTMDLENGYYKTTGQARGFFLYSKPSFFVDTQIHVFFSKANPSLSKRKLPDMDYKIHGFQESMSEILTSKQHHYLNK